jgi:hypothetical protein
MIIEYTTVAGKLLDRLTLDDEGTVVESTTGKGRDQVETFVRQYGAPLALRLLRSWSNGYVLTREVTTEEE